MPRKKHTKTEYEQCLRHFRKSAERHVVILEADMSEDMKRRAFGLSDKLRICGNNLTAKLSKALKQLFRTKKYRTLQKDYGNLSQKIKLHPEDKSIAAEIKAVVSKMREMQREYHVTWEDARTYMMYLKGKVGLNSIFTLSRAEDIWTGVEKVLYGGAKNIHFMKHGKLPEIRAKQINRGIVLSAKNNVLSFKCSEIGDSSFSLKPMDKFQQNEVAAVLRYLTAPEMYDKDAVNAILTTGEIIDTFRPCYASFMCKVIRGKLRVYIHLTIEGRAMPKYKPDGVTPRHAFGTGRVGADIGTQTVAYTSNDEVGLKNLSERGVTIFHAERQERRLLRKMDRSRKATNPENYNTDGTIKKGHKTWKKSKRYLKLQRAHANLCWKNAASRKYAINEDVNHLRSLGNVLITEPPNFKALQKRAKPEPLAPDGQQPKKNRRRKRFGKSLRNRCPGAFQAKLKAKFQVTGGSYHEVNRTFRASQYEHVSDKYVKKKLSQRIFALANGQKVQRDWYSSFLLYNTNVDYTAPDRAACLQTFEKQYKLQLEMIDRIRTAGIRVMNSGIAV